MSLRARPKDAPEATRIASSRLDAVLAIGCGKYASTFGAREEAAYNTAGLVDIEAKLTPAQAEKLAKMQAEMERLTSLAGESAKEGAGKAVTYTKQMARERLKDAKELWAGAKNPAHWDNTSVNELVKRFKTDYRRYFTERAWDNIMLSNGATRYYIADTGANMFCELEISVEKVKAIVYSKPYDSYNDKMAVEGSTGLGGQIAVETRSFKSMLSLVDKVIFRAVESFKLVTGKL